MFTLLQAVRLSFALYKLDTSKVESYESFRERFMHNHPGYYFSEQQIRATYDKWNLERVQAEVDARFKETYLRELTLHLVKAGVRQINLWAMLLLTLAVLFPPFYFESGGQSISLGLSFAFMNQVGRVEWGYLLCEIIAIVALWWFSHRMLALSHQTSPSAK